MISILPGSVSTGELHGYLLGAVGPRPIAFASTVDEKGRPNLSPFSFFNVFGSNPPILIFSPARRVRDNTTKHTLQNVLLTKEVVINIVNYDMVQQMSLSSTEYPKGTNEFEKSGLTMVKSDIVQPFRVGESPVQFECKVTKVEALGRDGGAGNLIFSEVVKIHIDRAIVDVNGVIDQRKIDQVARMGGNWYTRANKGMFEVPKPLSSIGMGVDALPNAIKNSTVLSGNDLGLLGNVEKIPSFDQVDEFLKEHSGYKGLNTEQLHKQARKFLEKGDVVTAWKILLINETNTVI
ncbi:flavin reductase family protein [Cytophaga sp. FL35]|nr:flavin reductase family protein [Cytophaga sp. FL35]